MLIVIAVAAGAALSVLVYNKVRERDPELASASMRRVHQLAAVVVVICTGAERLFDALQTGAQPVTNARSSGYSSAPSYSGSRPLVEAWDLEDDEPWGRS